MFTCYGNIIKTFSNVRKDNNNPLTILMVNFLRWFILILVLTVNFTKKMPDVFQQERMIAHPLLVSA